jgi:hypothetical protein
MAPTLTPYKGPAADWSAGERLLNDVFELVRARLPELAPDDPVRESFAKVLPDVGRSLGRPLIGSVGEQ